MYQLVSFDLQGTISEAEFSDELWLRVLPELMAQGLEISFDSAQALLKSESKHFGQYDARYYTFDYWLKRAGVNLTLIEAAALVTVKPKLDNELLKLISRLNKTRPVIVLSATTRDCIQIELGLAANLFKQIYSSWDDFATPGKPVELYLRIAEIFGIGDSTKCIHIGDHPEMDVENPKLAGWHSFYLNPRAARPPQIAELTAMLIGK